LGRSIFANFLSSSSNSILDIFTESSQPFKLLNDLLCVLKTFRAFQGDVRVEAKWHPFLWMEEK